MTVGLVLTAFGLGLRHGIDWDHIAAISDLTGSSRSRRDGWRLSMWYAVGHGVVVLALGAIVIAIGSTIPDGVDEWMGRVVGATLVALGAWLLFDLIRRGDDFRLRSRWMLVIDGTFRGLRRVRNRNGRREIDVDHAHPHEHDPEGLEHDHAMAHDHSHDVAEVAAESADLVDVTGGPGRSSWAGRVRRARSHGHPHRHRMDLPTDVNGSGTGAAAGIGMLHGVGIESPTQIAVFVASTAAVGAGAGMGLLVAWVLGLIVANAGLAVLAGWALLDSGRAAMMHRVLAIVVAVGSVGLGLLYLSA